MKKTIDTIKSSLQVVRFSWTYSQKVIGNQIWLITFYGVYISLHPVINAYFIKLVIDNLFQIENLGLKIFTVKISLILIAYFLVDSWDQFVFRHKLTLERILQRRLLSAVEIDLVYKHASLPITTIEDHQFRDQYALVKRESGFRIYPITSDVIKLLSTALSLFLSLLIISKFSFLYVAILLLVQIPRILFLKPAITKSIGAAALSAKKNRLWEIYLSYLESIRGAYEARILNIKSFVKKRLNKIQKETIGHYAKTQLGLLWGKVTTAILPMIGVFAIGFHMIQKVFTKIITVGDWQFVFNTSVRVIQEFKDFIDSLGTIQEATVFIEKFSAILSLKEEDSKKTASGSLKRLNSIEFKNISFKYPNTNNYALRNISFKIAKNENIALVGHNGAGKTTLVKLLCKFYVPTEGKILINDIDIQKIDTRLYRKLISALFQEFETYGVTAQESIGFGNIKRLNDISRIKKVARIVGINQYLSDLPNGYSTSLIREMEGGVGLSTGQWQKVAIARALFRKSKIIILDEPTSNLDPESEEEIFNKLIKTVKKRIMFLISHRFSTVKRADRIIVIELGKLVEQGSHKELMEKNGLYARLFRIQAESYKP